MVAEVESLNWNRNICPIFQTHRFLFYQNTIEILFISTRGGGGALDRYFEHGDHHKLHAHNT